MLNGSRTTRANRNPAVRAVQCSHCDDGLYTKGPSSPELRRVL